MDESEQGEGAYFKPEVEQKSEVIQKLEAFPNAVQTAYDELVSSPNEYLHKAIGITHPQMIDIIDNKMKDFVPLRRAQIKQLLDTSETLGIPLNPIGEITFTPGAIDNVRTLVTKISTGIANVQVREAAGVALKPTDLKGHNKEVGFWMAQSPIALVVANDQELKADYLQAHDQQLLDQGIDDPKARKLRDTYQYPEVNQNLATRLNTAAPFARAPITPNKEDIVSIHRTANHEAEHSSMHYLNVDLVQPNSVEGTMMSEFLAYRADYVSDPTIIDGMLSTFEDHYLKPYGGANDEQFNQMRVIANRIFNSQKDENGVELGTRPEYQANISAVAMVAKSPAEFEELCAKVIDKNEVIPEIEEVKRTTKETINKLRENLLS